MCEYANFPKCTPGDFLLHFLWECNLVLLTFLFHAIIEMKVQLNNYAI